MYALRWIMIACCIYLCHVNARCLYGSEPDCSFPCNCAVQSECEQGICPRGCASNTGVYSVSWAGPACQIGNVAYQKSCQHRGTSPYYPADMAVDGQPQTSTTISGTVRPYNYCSHQGGPPIDDVSDPAWWVVDLRYVHKVYNVTIYGRNTCPPLDGSTTWCEERLSQFSLRVGYANNYETGLVCGSHDPFVPLGGHVTVTCTTPRVGTHVYFVRTGGFQVGRCSLCEVIVIGHKYINCSGVTCQLGRCNEVTGCDACDGAYRPNCRQECEAGFYGINCAEECGNCVSGTTCNPSNGRCPEGCRLWWAKDTCDTQIPSPVVVRERALVGTISNTSVAIEWEPLNSVPSDLADFYKYRVRFREAPRPYQDGPLVSHWRSSLSHTFTNLDHNTLYDFTVVTYRVMRDREEAGEAYLTVSAKTKCTAPIMATVSVVTRNGNETNLGPITINHENIDSGCDETSMLWLAMRHENDADFTRTTADPVSASSTIIPGRSGQYTVKIIAANNEGLTATSTPQTVTVIETRSDPPTTTDIHATGSVPEHIIITVVVVAGVVVGVIVVTVLLLRHRSSNFNQRLQTDDEGNSHTDKARAQEPRTDASRRARLDSVLQGEGQYESVGLEAMAQLPERPYTNLRQTNP